MILLVTSAHPTLQPYDQTHLGRFVQPRHYSSIEATAASGMPWAADNDAFGNFRPKAFRGMLDRLDGLMGCLFVACPDVVGDHLATFERFERWGPLIRDRHCLPLALVAQDGLTPDLVPWSEIDALFIGGTTAWKMGGEVVRLCEATREHGKWLHFGRVNSRKRIDYARFLGCDSVDGQSWAKWRDRYLPMGLAHLSAPSSLTPEGRT